MKGIHHLASKLGVAPEDFDAESFMLQCSSGGEIDHQSLYGVLQGILGTRTQHSLLGLMNELLRASLSTGRPQQLNILSALIAAPQETEPGKKGLKSNYKQIAKEARFAGTTLLKLIAPDIREIRAYASLSDQSEQLLGDLIQHNMTPHVRAVLEADGLRNPLQFRTHSWPIPGTENAILSALCETPINGSHESVRTLLLGRNRPNNQETILRACAFLKKMKYDKGEVPLPDVPAFDPVLLEKFEGMVLKDVISAVVEQDKWVLDLKYEPIFREGLCKLTTAGLRVHLAVYHHYGYGYGLGYLEDRGSLPTPIEATETTMQRLNYGKKRSGSNTIAHGMGEVLCNHLLDQLTPDEALSLLTSDQRRMERLRYTQDRKILNLVENKSLIDRHFSSDLGL